MALVDAPSRRLLRARDAMDRSYAKPLDVPALARIALTSEAHFIRTFKRDVRRDAAPLSAAPAARARDGAAARDRPPVTEICLDVGFTSLGTFSRTFTRSSGCRRPRTARHGARARARRLRADMRGDGLDAPGSDREQQFRRSGRGGRRRSVRRHVHRPHPLLHLRARPGRGARLLRRQARPRGQHRRRPRLHALAHRQRARRARPRARARPARPDGPRRGDRRRRSASSSPRAAAAA